MVLQLLWAHSISVEVNLNHNGPFSLQSAARCFHKFAILQHFFESELREVANEESLGILVHDLITHGFIYYNLIHFTS